MKLLYTTIAFCLATLPLISLRASMACSPTTPLYTHFVYMFAHASLLHWLANSWSLLVFHNLFRIPRLIVAYVAAVLVSFIPSLLHTPFTPYSLYSILPIIQNSKFKIQNSPVLGLSVFVCFFLGLAARHLYHVNRRGFILSMVVLVISCFLPGFAGSYHIIMFAVGFIYYPIEQVCKNYRHYASPPHHAH